MIDVRAIQRHVAQAAVGPTTLRKMHGVAGKREEMQDLFIGIDLHELEPDRFPQLLDEHTLSLARIFDGNWGAARKALNLFFRDATANIWLREEYKLDRIEGLLEIPLDSRTMKKIRAQSESLEQTSVSALRAGLSERYQDAGRVIAQSAQVAPIHLDYQWWSERS